MKHLAVIIVMLILSSTAIAQDFQGQATYKSHRKMDIKLDSTQMETEMHKRMIEMMKKQFEKTYILSFNKEESLYKEDEELEAPQPAGMVMVVMGSGESGELYKNLKEDRYTDQNDMFGKIFLIEDKLEKINWKLGSETKNIGEYTCYKATTTRMAEVVQTGISINGDKDLDTDAEPEMEEITITAWYTPQIPVNNGPASYHGLPGLILEIHNGNETLICSKIVLNLKDKIEIEEPTTGKKVTQEKFDAIMEKKMKEMENRYQREDRNGDGIKIEIRG
jgi:GLPGLI family protein